MWQIHYGFWICDIPLLKGRSIVIVTALDYVQHNETQNSSIGIKAEDGVIAHICLRGPDNRNQILLRIDFRQGFWLPGILTAAMGSVGIIFSSAIHWKMS